VPFPAADLGQGTHKGCPYKVLRQAAPVFATTRRQQSRYLVMTTSSPRRGWLSPGCCSAWR
jgi:hypothetical protein